MTVRKLLAGMVLSVVLVCVSCSGASTTLDPAYARDTVSDWSGFVQRIYTISREFPHKVLELERKTWVEYKTDVVM